ncbi:GNAT family N-acetyltransferase [Rossellomorea aquimaris]|uniref:GNAT family N-acetyltransferase n=1 Tax=Rossellomorea aquimaris TaxID=189382 RepID=UPI001CD3CFBB|nr:N-acetyltransferase [Rossellomorea aquimaris]MCA1054460.1 GNAT family N-acetyltransferase [Rossellomorea aquimaris]
MLTTKQLHDIKQLQELCEKNEKIKLKLNWDMLQSRESHQDDYFHYEHDELIGYLALYGFGDQYELCGMVHPLFRKKGIFKGMFHQALTSLKARDAHSLLINTPGTSSSGKGFAEAIRARYDFTEYEMKWDPRHPMPDSGNVSTREMMEDDIPYCIKLDIDCFGQKRSDAEAMLKQTLTETGQRSMMILADGHTVGKIRIQRMEGESYIYGFAIDPDYQGRGIGKKALSLVVKEESLWTNQIFLDVAATNSRALKLYEMSGFQTIYSQDYHQFAL